MLLRTLLLLMLPLAVHAKTSVSLNSVQGHSGDEVELSVSLLCSEEVTACQLSINLPEELEYVAGSAEINSARLSSSHQMSAGMSSDNCRKLNILVHSLSLDKLKGEEGELLTFRLKLGGEPGDYQLSPSVVLSDKQGKAIACDPVVPTVVTILGYKAVLPARSIEFDRVPIKGSYTRTFDITNSGNESMEVLGVSSTSDYFHVSPQTASIAAGQSKTFTLTYAPVLAGLDQATITIAIGGQSQSIQVNTMALQVTAHPFSVNELSVQGASGAAYDEVTIGVDLQNMEPIVAAQCSFILPEALQFVEGSAEFDTQRGVDHEIGATLEGQRLSFIMHSPTNTAFKGHSGRLFTFRLRLVSTGGVYPLIPQDVVLSNSTANDMTSDVHGGEVYIAAPRAEVAEQLNFGRLPMERPVTAVLVLHNTGEQPLVLQRVVFSDPAFSIVGDYPLETAPGASTNLTILHQSSEPGSFVGSMQLYTNDPDRRMITVSLRGTGYVTNELTISGRIMNGQQEQYKLRLGLNNSLPVVAMQFDIHWISDMVTTVDAIAFTQRAAGHEAVLTPLDDHTHRCYVYSEENTPINSGNGTVLSLLYNNVRESGSTIGSTIRIDNIILSTTSGQNCASTVEAEMEVNPLLGDVNSDGIITIADVVAVVGFAMGQNPDGCSRTHADVNSDGQVDATDVVASTLLLMKEIYD